MLCSLIGNLSVLYNLQVHIKLLYVHCKFGIVMLDLRIKRRRVLECFCRFAVLKMFTHQIISGSKEDKRKP